MTTPDDLLQRLLPPHKAGLFLTHNEHLNYYESAEAYLVDLDNEWKDAESKQRAILTNEVWELIWYPNTPVCSICIAAPTLTELLEFAKQLSKHHDYTK